MPAARQAHHFNSTGIAVIAVLSLFILFFGVTAIIENKSPENLSTVWTTVSGFINFIQYHFMILAGALGLTFSVWMFTQNSFRR
jgi:hypothetical protein